MAEHNPHDSLTPPVFETPTRVLFVVAPFYRDIADQLIAGATRAAEAGPSGPVYGVTTGGPPVGLPSRTR